jgi:hypothetical protein
MTHDPILTDVHTESADRPTRSKVGARTTGKAAPSSDRAAAATPRRLPKAPIAPPRTVRRAKAESVSREHPLRADSVPGLTAGARPLAIVPRSLDEAMQLARAVVASGLAPRGFDTAEACMVAILHGLEVGLAPLAALQRIAIIEGRPTIWGDGALALVRASGLADLIEEWSEGSGPADWCAICRVKRKGDTHPIERRFSVEDARRADLWGRPGPWQRYPLRMLQMRARAFALRDTFADVLGGLYLREELDGEPTLREPTLREAAVRDPVPAGAPHPGADATRATSGTLASGRTDSVVTDPARSGPIAAGSGPPPAKGQRSLRHPLKAPPPSWFGPPIEPDPPSLPPTVIERTPPPSQPSPSYRRQQSASRAVTGKGPLPRDAAHALRLRRKGGWTIPRPRRIASRSTPGSTRLGALGDAAARPEARRTAQRAASEPADVLALIDDALSCARDPAAFTEVLGELDDRISALGADDRTTARRIIERHHRRVQALDDPASRDDPAAGQGADP